MQLILVFTPAMWQVTTEGRSSCPTSPCAQGATALSDTSATGTPPPPLGTGNRTSQNPHGQ